MNVAGNKARPHCRLLAVCSIGFGVVVILLGAPLSRSCLAQAPRSDPFRDLKVARAYRAGFANRTDAYETLLTGWRLGDHDVRKTLRTVLDRLVKQHSSVAPGGAPSPEVAPAITETVNEILQGQIVEGNESLLNALRARLPRPDIMGPPAPIERLPTPLGNTRKELESFDRAIEAFGVGMRAALSVLPLRGGDQLLRAAGQPNEYDGFPQFTKLKEPFEPANLNQTPDKTYPVQVELSLLSRLADRAAQAGVEKARRLFILSALKEEPTGVDEEGKPQPKARLEALTELKRTVHQSYILAAALGALQTAGQFQDNGGQSQLVHTALGREFFERIRAGMIPFGNSKTFVPSGPIEGYIKRAKDAIVEASQAEALARDEDVHFKTAKVELVRDKESQRNLFLSPLMLLTGLDPRDDSAIDLDHDGRTGEIEEEGNDKDKDGRNPEHESFDGLKTISGRQLYRAIVIERVEELLKSGYAPGKTTSRIGALGDRIFSLLDAQLAGEQALNTLNNVPRQIAIIQERAGKINLIASETGESKGALEMSIAATEVVRFNSGVKGVEPFFEVSLDPSAMMRGALRGDMHRVISNEQVRSNNAMAESEVRTLLLGQENALIEVQRSKLHFDRLRTNLALDYQKMDQLIADFAESQALSSDLWFNDPTNRVLLTVKLRQADLTLEETVVALYQLARVLEYEWNEEYRNPAIIPPDVQGVAGTLGQGLYDRFTQTEDVFNIQNVADAGNFQGALREWDHKMREIGSNVIAVRGPLRTQKMTNRTISFRDDILGLDNLLRPSPKSDDEKVSAFRRHIKERRLTGDSPLPGLALTFGLALESPGNVQPLLPFKNHWNLRVVGVTVESVADSGYSLRGAPDCVFYLTQAGTISNQSYLDSTEKQKERQITRHLVPVTPDRPERSVFRTVVPSRVNGHSDPTVPDYHREIGGEQPIAASHWQLRLDPDYPRNFGFDVMKLRDIRITFEYVDGNPREFAW